MNDNGHKKDRRELGPKVADAQTRIFLKLVFDLWEALEEYDQDCLSRDSASVGRQLRTRRAGFANTEDSRGAIFLQGFGSPSNAGQPCSSAAVAEEAQDHRRPSKAETQAV
jgi:hypothetical protein